MNETETRLTRRQFLRDTAGLAIAGAAGASALTAFGAPTGTTAPAEKMTKVVLVRNPDVLDKDGKVVASVVQKMLDQATAELAGKPDPLAAWKTWFHATDTVGVKTNAWKFLSTPPELEQAIRQRLIDVGVAPERIAVDDRGVLNNPVFQKATALVNTRPMRTHHWAGVGSLIKNYIMFAKTPSDWHGDSCADLAGIWALPHVAGRTRLNVLVMLTPLFHSVGPHDFSAKHTWPYRGLLVGTDPVAVDATGLRIIEAQRRLFFGKDEPLEVPPKHIRVAAEKHKLGVADPARIDLKRLGWADGALV